MMTGNISLVGKVALTNAVSCSQCVNISIGAPLTAAGWKGLIFNGLIARGPSFTPNISRFFTPGICILTFLSGCSLFHFTAHLTYSSFAGSMIRTGISLLSTSLMMVLHVVVLPHPVLPTMRLCLTSELMSML